MEPLQLSSDPTELAFSTCGALYAFIGPSLLQWPSLGLALLKVCEYNARQREPGTGFAHGWFVRAPDDYLWS